ncbi:hypothetical protein SEVIR_2G208700v4 [Setaria viridis]|nr:hypothetical protein SEVIR_2G208700v2 [Setaria viridis]
MADDAGSGAAPELASPPPPPPLRPLPSYSEMILEAIDALDNANGSNKTAISGYLKNKCRASLPSDHTSLLTINLGRMKSSGELVFARNNYFRPDGDDEEVKEEEPSATAPAGPASPLRPDGYKDPAVDEDSTGVFDAASVYLDIDDFDAQLGLHSVRDADDTDVPALAPGVAADDIGVPAPAPDGVVADDIDVPAPAPVVTADAAAGPVKRGRGRPPKPKVAVAEDSPAEASLVAADAVAGPAKRGRGRPPKPKDPAAMGTDGESTADANAPVKRGRGRPPKAQGPHY